ncbi:MAG: alpha/beta fold hydrolase [Nanoarchaeota archaeon]|nr:alpha/beta fold hydrolase [Nanoarchaeota archaeon]
MNKIFIILIAFILLTGSAQAYYKTGRGEDGVNYPYDAIAEYHSPIIFIPGMMGTVLVESGNWPADDLWPGHPREDRSELMLNIDGITPTVAGVRIVPKESMRLVWGTDIYDGFFKWMGNTTITGYTFRGKDLATGKYGWQGRSFYDHPYDFRLDNRLQVESDQVDINLNDFVDDVLEKTHSKKVILVAHSMGGYQARMYAAKNKNKVRAIIFFSSPHHGAPRAYQTFTKGYNFGIDYKLITTQQIWDMGKNWPGGYQLIPDWEFVKDENGNLLSMQETLKGNWIPEVMYNMLVERAEGLGSEAEVQAMIQENIRTGLNSHDVADEMLVFREEFNKITLDPQIRVELINGDKQMTTQFFTSQLVDAEISYIPKILGYQQGAQKTTIPVKLLKLEGKETDEGDVTVPKRGLKWGSYNTQWINEQHGSVPNNKEAQSKMMTIVNELNHDQRDIDRVRKINNTISNLLTKLVAKSPEVAKSQAEYMAKKIKDEKERLAALKDRQEKVSENLKSEKNEQVKYEKSINAMEAELKGIEESIKQSNLQRYEKDLEGRVYYMMFHRLLKGRFNRVQVIIPNEGQYEGEKDFKAFVVIDNYKVIDAGIGNIKPMGVKVTVPTLQMFNDIIEGRQSLKHAYEQDLIHVEGGPMVGFLAKVASLVEKFKNEA